MLVYPVVPVLAVVEAVAVADLVAQEAVESAYLDRAVMALAAQCLALRPEEKVVEVAPEAREQIVLVAVTPEVGALTAAVVVAGVIILDTSTLAMVRFGLSGPVLHAHSRPQTQEIYKWNSLFASKMVSLLSIQSWKTTSVRLFRKSIPTTYQQSLLGLCVLLHQRLAYTKRTRPCRISW
jgi:hypothetical protein